MNTPSPPQRRLWGDPRRGAQRYWRRVRWLTALLLGVWLAVTLLVPWCARDLNAWSVAGMPLGLWMASQGAITVYLVLIVFYALVCEALERGADGDAAASDRSRHE